MNTIVAETEEVVAALAEDYPGIYVREWGKPIDYFSFDESYEYEVVDLSDPRIPEEGRRRAQAVERAFPIVQFYLMIERTKERPAKREVKPVEVNVPWRELAVVLGFVAWSILKVVGFLAFGIVSLFFMLLAGDPILVAVTEEGAHVVCYSWLPE